MDQNSERSLSGGWTITPSEAAASKKQNPSAKQTSNKHSSDKHSSDKQSSDKAYSEQPVSDQTTTDSKLSTRSSAELIILGVFGGLFLLYGFAWIEISKAYAPLNEQAAAGSGSIGFVLQNIFYWVAPAAPIAWFLGCVSFTKKFGTLKLLLLLTAGAVIIFPYPFLFAGGTV